MAYVGGGMAVIIALLVGALWVTEGRLDAARKDLAAAESANETAVAANSTIQATLAVCQQTNQANAEQREAAKAMADAAIERVALLEAELLSIEEVNIVQTDTNCRTLDEPLPAGFTDQLCIAAAKNCRPD